MIGLLAIIIGGIHNLYRNQQKTLKHGAGGVTLLSATFETNVQITTVNYFMPQTIVKVLLTSFKKVFSNQQLSFMPFYVIECGPDKLNLMWSIYKQ